MTPSTFTTTSENQRVSIRPSWLSIVAPLGRIHGDEATLIGAVRDIHALDGLIDWGIAAASDVTRLETQIGKRLTDLFESGTAIECWVDCDADRVADLKPLTVSKTAAVNRWNVPSTMLPKLGTLATREQDFAVALGEADEQFSRVEKQRQAALSLRRTWSISEMSHRGTFPSWMPDWVRTLIVEESRFWIQLPSAPAPAPEVQAVPPVIQAAIVEPAPEVPVKTFADRLKGVFA